MTFVKEGCSMSDTAEKFIEKYKELEEAVRITYGLKDSDSISYYLTGQKEYQKYKDDIKYCQEVRNLLSHKKKINGSYAIEPSVEMLRFIDNLIDRIRDRTKCFDIQVGMKNVYWQPMDGKVKQTMQNMRRCMYSHVPILDNDGVVIGVFDENSVFNYLADEEKVEINDSLTFADISKYISLHDREMESFVFFRPNEYVEELENQFESARRKGRRIGIAFITSNGTSDGKLQGIITPWDIIAASAREQM